MEGRARAFAIPDILVPRVARELGCSVQIATQKVAAYVQFLTLKANTGDDAMLAAPPGIDEVWRLHVLDTRSYASCEARFGRVFHYSPDSGAPDAAAIAATRMSAAARYGADGFDDALWSFGDGGGGGGDARGDDDDSSRKQPRTGAEINITIREQTGEITDLRVLPTTQLGRVFDVYAQRKGLNTSSLRFLCRGARLNSDQTVRDGNIQEGDRINCMFELVGDIGVFGQHSDTPGIELLMRGASASAAELATVCRAVRARSPHAPSAARPFFASFPRAALLDAAQCQRLARELDEARARAEPASRDFKLARARTALAATLGAVAVDRLVAFFREHGGPGARVDAIVLRRSAPLAECINFHTDFALRTMQVPLNDDFLGGRLVFARERAPDAATLETPDRPAGSATLHNCAIVHAVTKLEAGARYALFLLQHRP